MKKIIKYIFILVLGCSVFIACEDPYSKQITKQPNTYEQLAPQDTTGFTVVLKTGLSPLTIQASKLTEQLSLLTCTSVFALKDTAAMNVYKLQFSSTSNFTEFKSIPISYNGKANSDVSVGAKEFNDSIKKYNKNAVQRTVYIRLLSIIVKNGTLSPYKSATLPLLVTPNNYAPVAINDVASLPMGSSITIDVLGNDTDPEKDVLTIASVTTPTHGTASIVSGKVLYTPSSGYSGADNFSYTISDGNGNTSIANVDVTVMAIMPYTATKPRPWYLVGSAIGNGSWNNTISGLGAALYPLGVVNGNKYNSLGDGEFTYTGYIAAGQGFKLIRDPGSWNDQWGLTNGVYTHNTGDNISVSTSGYYTVYLNSILNTLTINPASVTPTIYTQIGLIGDFNGWGGDVVMTPAQSSNNHIWYTTYTFTGSGQAKFRANGGWATNWGTPSSFDGDPLYSLCGIGTSGGKNIAFTAGTYTIIFNDIDGSYYFK